MWLGYNLLSLKNGNANENQYNLDTPHHIYQEKTKSQMIVLFSAGDFYW